MQSGTLQFVRCLPLARFVVYPPGCVGLIRDLFIMVCEHLRQSRCDADQQST